MKNQKLLTFNSHEAYVYALSRIGHQWHVIDNLPGRYTCSWDTSIRPIPENVTLIPFSEFKPEQTTYDCIIAHSIDDLLIVKKTLAPKILIIHNSLNGYIAQEGNKIAAQDVQKVLNTYLEIIKGSVVSVSEMKRSSWGVKGSVIPPFVDGNFFQGYSGEIAAGLRVANQIFLKHLMLDLDTHAQITAGFPVKLVGYNPDIPNVQRAKDIFELRQLYCSYRFYIHTAKEGYEDGYNFASLEAMACGMPVVCNEHSSSPIVNGVNGVMSRSIDELREGIERLCADLTFAKKLGAAARETVLQKFSLQKFTDNWNEAIAKAIYWFGK